MGAMAVDTVSDMFCGMLCPKLPDPQIKYYFENGYKKRGKIYPCSPGFLRWKTKKKLVPAVAVGNVGQLAVDLIVSTLNMRQVGYIHTDCLIPMVGNNPYATSADSVEELHTSADSVEELHTSADSVEELHTSADSVEELHTSADSVEELHTTAEVYTAAELKLAVLQIRTPIIQTKSRKFSKLVVSWIKSSQFLRTIVLSSSHAYQRDDQQLHGVPLRYLATPALQTVSGEGLKELGWSEMERVAPFPGLSDSHTEQRLYIPGGGITKGLFTDCCAEELSLAVVLIFCSEGDNIPDAFSLLNHLNDWLHLVDTPSQGPNKWRIPASWRLLFGSGIPPALF